MENLILFNDKFEIKYLINVCDLKLKNNIYNDSYRYINGQDNLFFELTHLIDDYNIRFSKDPLSFKEEITVSDLILVKKIKKITYTKDEILAKALMENELKSNALSKQTEALAQGLMETDETSIKINNKTQVLAKGLMENELNNIKLKQQVQALSKAVFEMALSK